MSQYITSTVLYDFERQRMRDGISELLREAGDCTSSCLLSACGTLKSANGLIALDHRWEALERIPSARRAMQICGRVGLARAESLTLESKQAASIGDNARASALAMQAHETLQSTVARTARRLQRDEQAAAVDALTRALRRRGYNVSIACGKRSTGLWAARGHEILAALVQPGGAMEIDNAGLSGDACATTMHTLEADLREEGCIVSIQRRIDHGDPGGGSLIRRAGQTGAARPEVGLVLQHEGGTPTAGARVSVNDSVAVKPRMQTMG